MVRKICSACCSAWTMDFPSCPFCGGSARELPALASPAPELRRYAAAPVSEKPQAQARPEAPAPRIRENYPGPAGVRSSSSPSYGQLRPRAPAPAPAPAMKSSNGAASPSPAPAAKPAAATPAPARPPAASPAPGPARPRPFAGEALQPICPLYLGIISLVGVALLPPTLIFEANRVVGVLGFCLLGFFAPFAPIAWYVSQSYENRFRSLGIPPGDAILRGKRLGMTGTFLLVLEGMIVGFLVAALRLSGQLPRSFLS